MLYLHQFFAVRFSFGSMDIWYQREVDIVNDKVEAQNQTLSQLRRIANEKGFIKNDVFLAHPIEMTKKQTTEWTEYYSRKKTNSTLRPNPV